MINPPSTCFLFEVDGQLGPFALPLPFLLLPLPAPAVCLFLPLSCPLLFSALSSCCPSPTHTDPEYRIAIIHYRYYILFSLSLPVRHQSLFIPCCPLFVPFLPTYRGGMWDFGRRVPPRKNIPVISPRLPVSRNYPLPSRIFRLSPISIRQPHLFRAILVIAQVLQVAVLRAGFSYLQGHPSQARKNSQTRLKLGFYWTNPHDN